MGYSVRKVPKPSPLKDNMMKYKRFAAGEPPWCVELPYSPPNTDKIKK
jgi:hypothetical protein